MAIIQTDPEIAVIVYDGLHIIGQIVPSAKGQIALQHPLQIKYELLQTGLNPMGGRQATNMTPYAPLATGAVTFPTSNLATYRPNEELRIRYLKWLKSKETPQMAAPAQLNG